MIGPEHAELSPSGAKVLVQCKGSLAMQARYPESERSIPSKEGDATHEVGARILYSYADPAQRPLSADSFLGVQHENGTYIDQHMVDGALEYVMDVLTTVQKFGAMSKLQIEQRMPIPRLNEAGKCWGTPDCWFYDATTKTVYMWDLKYGFRKVEVFECWQLICYLSGVMSLLQPIAAIEPDLKFDLRISQPRNYGPGGTVRSWTGHVSQLRPHFNTLRSSFDEALKPDAPLTSGPACKDCTARHACPAAQQAGYNAIDVSTEQRVYVLDDNQLGVEMDELDRAAEAIDMRRTGLKLQAEQRLRAGSRIQGRSMVEKFSRQNWQRPRAEVLSMGDMLGVDLRKEDTPLITPKQAITKGLSPAMVEAYSGSTSKGFEVTKDDGVIARRKFSSIIPIDTQPEGSNNE